MHFKRFWLGLAALAFCFHAHAVDAQAANNGSNPGISQKTAPCDWSYPTRCLKVNADGSINTSGGGGGGAVTAASGAYASGSLAAGAIVDLGTGASPAANTTNAYLKSLSTTLPAGTNTLGATYSFQDSSGNVLPASAAASAPIAVSTATTTQIVALSASKKIYVTSFDVIAAGTGNISFVYGTGSNCGTGTTALTGTYNLVAQAGISKGNGLGAVLVVPASNALCVTTSAAVGMAGSVSYAQY